MKILMTGGSGFVGKHLLPLLEGTGYDIYHLLRETKGFRQESIWNFKEALPRELPACDVVIHLAAYVHFGQKMNLEQYEVNTVSTAKLVKYCQKTDAFMIIASMVGVHGTKKYISKEAPIAPSSHYGMSKYLAEQIVRLFLEDAAILRIAGIYGLAGPSHLGLNPAITNAVYFQQAPTLKGSGKGKRNYICVRDVAQWIFQLVQNRQAEHMSDYPRKVETLYLASPESMTVEQYLRTIVRILLPGKDIIVQKGGETVDCLVKPTPSPFPSTSFTDYLKGLAQTKVEGRK